MCVSAAQRQEQKSFPNAAVDGRRCVCANGAAGSVKDKQNESLESASQSPRVSELVLTLIQPSDLGGMLLGVFAVSLALAGAC